MDRRQTTPRRRSRWPAVALSAAAHAGLVAALLLAVTPPAAPPIMVPDIVPFALVPPPRKEEPPPPETPQPTDAPAAPAPAASTSPIRPPVLPPPPQVQPLVAPVAETPKPATTLGAAELAGARTAGGGGTGSGAGGGSGAGAGCDMVERLEAALRRDGRVRAAVAQAGAAPGRALLVWDGDWVTSQGEAGKGLAGLRQAIAWEVGFAPEACRNEPMRGLVLISLAEGRVALGAGAWRWTDLLGRGRGHARSQVG